MEEKILLAELTKNCGEKKEKLMDLLKTFDLAELGRKIDDEREKEIAQLKEQLGQAERDYNSLKMARMLEVTDGDVEGAKKRVAGLIREVNRCITMLSEK